MTVLHAAVPRADRAPADLPVQVLDELVSARASGCPRRLAAAEDAVVLLHFAAATRIAHRHRGRGVELEDLVQVARMGLVKAVRGWQPQPDGGLMQYAGPMMLGEVQRYIRDRSTPIRVPRRIYELRPAIWDARIALEQDGRDGTVTAIAAIAGVSVEDVGEHLVSYRRSRPDSIHDVDDADDRPDLVCERAERDRSAVEDRTALRSAMRFLTDRERLVVGLRFFEDLNQQEIADRIGVSQMQVSRLLRSIFTKLRRHIEGVDAPARQAS